MKTQRILWLTTVVLMAANGVARCEEPVRLEDRVVEYTLPNGMKFLLMHRPGVPVFSTNISFRVGGVDEKPGITGLSHLFEHMAFKGTRVISVKNYRAERPLLKAIDKAAVDLSNEMARGDLADPKKVAELQKRVKELEDKARQFSGKEEIGNLYMRNGGLDLNAYTGKDTTCYVVSLPSNRLDLWAWLESDRLLNPVLREFYSERDVVCEERRLGVETQPMGKLYEVFMATAFIAHPARYEVIGWMSDIQTVTRPMAEAYNRTYYIPANSAAALVGNLDIEKCKKTIARYFGRLPSRPLPPPVRTIEPEQRGERRAVVESDAKPWLLIGWHKGHPLDADEAVFEVIDTILSRGHTARFYKTIVRDRKLATSVGSFTGPTERYPNLFCVSAMPLHPHTTREVEQAIYEVMGTLVTDPPGDEELQKVRNNLHADFLRELESNRGMAAALANYQMIYGDWRLIQTRLAKIDAVTAQDVRRVAEKFFAASNRTVGEIVQTAKPAEKGK